MWVDIKIGCEDEQEIISHLQILIKQIKKETKNQKGEITKAVTLSDNNCYGYHACKITPTI
jgi:hypothetical protein